MNANGVIIVFAKAPVSGQVKTRLIPDIGRYQATNIYKELLTKTLNTVSNYEYIEKHLWISGDISHEFFTSFNNKEYFKLHKQTGTDLGDRMFNAFNHVLSSHPYAVLIGSDCPEISNTDLESALRFLKSGKDLVLGPAEDGGYYLIGLRNNYFELFSDIEWGNENVFDETCYRAEKMKLDVALLPTHSDVDRISDLNSYYRAKENAMKV